ncbi:hypothetical protein CGCF413_v003552 [Colletotrichum fructicola]|nr:hypothetical protein CGCF413_v003552 [Colletotrichum fructicola]
MQESRFKVAPSAGMRCGIGTMDPCSHGRLVPEADGKNRDFLPSPLGWQCSGYGENHIAGLGWPGLEEAS